jgi:hypothetical protein
VPPARTSTPSSRRQISSPAGAEVGASTASASTGASRSTTDVDLELAAADAPGFVRRPDIVVVHRDVPRRIQREGGVIRASDVLVVVELVSPSSRRTDHVIKRGEYADAGIAHYWIVDLAEPVSLLACHLAGEFGYVDGAAATGTVTTTTTPFAVEIDLSALG